MIEHNHPRRTQYYLIRCFSKRSLEYFCCNMKIGNQLVILSFYYTLLYIKPCLVRIIHDYIFDFIGWELIT